jgi:hypothetical protein
MCTPNCKHGRRLSGLQHARDGAELVAMEHYLWDDGSATVEWRRKDGRTGVHARYAPNEWELVDAEGGPTAGRLIRASQAAPAEDIS